MVEEYSKNYPDVRGAKDFNMVILRCQQQEE